jgi:phosphoglycolate phosphatase
MKALLFDKDGTLFAFDATWAPFTQRLIAEFAAGDSARQVKLCRKLGFDWENKRFLPDSLVIAGTLDEAVGAVTASVPAADPAQVALRLRDAAQALVPVPAVPLRPLLSRLRARGLRLGVATNDAESVARAHLAVAGIDDLFEAVIGYDTGFGAKPAPGMCLAFARAIGVSAGEIAMIGDSTHDLSAAQAAGMVPVGVLTGPAPRESLAPFAVAVLDHIGQLPDWLDRRDSRSPA